MQIKSKITVFIEKNEKKLIQQKNSLYYQKYTANTQDHVETRVFSFKD